MGIFDKAKDFADQHEEQIDSGIDRAGDLLDDKTGARYADQVDQAQEFLKKQTGER